MDAVCNGLKETHLGRGQGFRPGLEQSSILCDQFLDRLVDIVFLHFLTGEQEDIPTKLLDILRMAIDSIADPFNLCPGNTFPFILEFLGNEWNPV